MTFKIKVLTVILTHSPLQVAVPTAPASAPTATRSLLGFHPSLQSSETRNLRRPLTESAPPPSPPPPPRPPPPHSLLPRPLPPPDSPGILLAPRAGGLREAPTPHDSTAVQISNDQGTLLTRSRAMAPTTINLAMVQAMVLAPTTVLATVTREVTVT